MACPICGDTGAHEHKVRPVPEEQAGKVGVLRMRRAARDLR